ncbi:MAG: SMC-Scp complex subunit ScpB [Candidatus Omnitrophica bacterium]|nr:SMC-Scp complex subunit ScpB [Candidatus Omnitrophota bacterium]
MEQAPEEKLNEAIPEVEVSLDALTATVQSAVVDVEQAKTQMAHIKGVIETILFINERPVSINEFKRVLEAVGAKEIKDAVLSLIAEYEQRESGVIIKEIAEGYQMLSNPKYASYARAFYKTRHKEKLSKPALETLAIIAYKQPVTRAEIEVLRGVNSDGVFNHLVDKELIKIVGRKEAPGKPYLYGTNKQFLEYFGLRSLQDLPRLEEFPDLLERAEARQDQLDLESNKVTEEPSDREKAIAEKSE